MNIYEKLLSVQGKLKAPKSQYNDFGHYSYRNAEDILEAVKPLCNEVKALVLLTDEIKIIGERFYVEATAKFVDCEKADVIEVKASAREEENKKGMDGSQVTGASSSYARKYALNGLFAIDDTKDSDSTNKGDSTKNEPKKAEKKETKPEVKAEEEKPAMTLERAKALTIMNNGGEKQCLGDCTMEQLSYIREKFKSEEYREAASLILIDMGRKDNA